MKYALFISLVLILVWLFFQNYIFGYPLDWGGDNFGHLFKVWKIWQFGYGNWAGEWYAGYPFERFYPPLSYLLGAAYANLFNSDLIGYKLVLLTSMFVSLFSTYFVTKKVGMTFYECSIVAVFYTFSIWNLLMPLDGGFPRYLAVSLAPLLPLIFLALFNFWGGKRALIGAGLLIGIMVLIHHTFLVTAAYSALFIGFALLALKVKLPIISRTIAKKFFVNAIIISAVTFAISAFWVIPFFADVGTANFKSENTIAELYLQQSRTLDFILTPQTSYMTGSFDYLISWQSLLFSILITIAPLVALVFRRYRYVIALCMLTIGYWVAAGLSLGVNGPLWIFNQLPLLVMVPPNRWLDALPLLAAFQMALLLRVVYNGFSKLWPSIQRLVFVAWVIILILPCVLVAPLSAYYTTPLLPDDFTETMNYIKSNSQIDERYYQYGLLARNPNSVLIGAIVGYTPALTGVDAVDGWYRQGDPSDAFKNQLYWALSEAPNRAAELLDSYNIKHIILTLGAPFYDKVYAGLISIGYFESFTSGSYHVLSKTPSGYVVPIAKVYAIGDEWVIRSSLESYSFQVSYVGSKIPENFSYESIKQFDIVVLAGYQYAEARFDWVTELRMFSEQGGIVIVDPYNSPDQNSDDLFGLGVSSYLVDVAGSLKSVEPDSNMSWSSFYSWEGGNWGGCSFEGAIDKKLQIGSEIGLGTIQLGKGSFLFIGFNMLFHGLYTGDLQNINSLKSTFQTLLDCSMNYNITLLKDGHIQLHYSSQRPFTLRVSENYFPHWQIRLNESYYGVPSNDTFSGVMLLRLPEGEFTMDLEFVDPYYPLRFVSLAFAIIAVLFVTLPLSVFKLKKKL